MRQILKDENLQNEFLNKGYIKLPLLSPDEVEYLLSELKKLQPADGYSPQNGEGLGMTFHATLLDTNTEYRRKANNLIKKVFQPHINRLLTFEAVVCNFFVKPPHTGSLKVHQNWNFLDNPNDTTLTIWCPLVDADEVNGTLHILEGSHKLVPHIVTVNIPEYFDNFAEKIERTSTPVSVRAGEALIFDDSLLHGSNLNNSSRPRYAVQIVCVPKDVKPVVYRGISEEKFEIFEMGNDFFVEHTPMDLAMGKVKRKSLGFIENKNRFLSESEFDNLLRNGEKIRQTIYFPENKNKQGLFGTIREKIKSVFK